MNKNNPPIPGVFRLMNASDPKTGKRVFMNFVKSHANYRENPHGLEIVQVAQSIGEDIGIGMGFTIDQTPNGRVIATCAHCLTGDYTGIITADGSQLPIATVFASRNNWKANDIAFAFVRGQQADEKVSLPIADVLTNGELAGAYNGGELGAVQLKTFGNIPGMVATVSEAEHWSIRLKRDIQYPNSDIEYGLLDGLSQEGSSGSPVFTDEGVMGMVFAGYNEIGFTLYLPIQPILQLYENQVKPQVLKL